MKRYKKNNLPSKNMKNFKLAKNNENKQRLRPLNTLLKNVFSFCKSWEPQNRKRVFFRPIGLLKKFFVDGFIFSSNFFLNFSISTNLKVKKIFYTFFSTSTKQKVKNFFSTFFSSLWFLTFEKILFSFLLKNSFVVFKKKVCTFCSSFQNLKVNKNPRKNGFQIAPLGALNVLFEALKTEKLRFLSIFNIRLNYFAI